MPGPRDGHFNKYKRKEKIDDWTLLSYDTYVDKSTKAFQAAVSTLRDNPSGISIPLGYPEMSRSNPTYTPIMHFTDVTRA